MFATFILLLASTFAESKVLALQIHLDRAGYSCNTADGVWGPKGERALERFLLDRNGTVERLTPDEAYDRYFAEEEDPFRIETVTKADLAALVKLPSKPAEAAKLERMGYETIREMFAERGHVSQIALARMNPGVDWGNIQPGLKLVIPDFPSFDALLDDARRRRLKTQKGIAAVVRVSLSRFEITAFDVNGRCLALMPCSIAAKKSKVPQHGELRFTSMAAWPNYTHTPDHVPSGKKLQRHVLPPGENNPVGVAWLGLNLPGYGIHGTPIPESIGFTGSHGCFRLANWNAARLFAICRPETRVFIDP